MSGPTEPEILIRLLESIGQSAGCCSQMAHQRKDPRWLAVRDQLENMRKMVSVLAVRSSLSATETHAMLDRRKARHTVQ
jgi:hypothetical protein